MSARPLRPVPLVSRPRPDSPRPRSRAWWSRRRALLSAGAVTLAGLVAFGGVRSRLLPLVGPGLRPPPASPTGPAAARAEEPPPLAAVAAPTATRTPAPTATATFTPTATPVPPPAATSTPTLLDEGIATRLVERYYGLINAHDLQGAYGLLGAQWRQRQAYGDYAAGYRGTLKDTASVTATAEATKDSVHGYVVALDLNAQLASRVQRYKGLYFVAVEDGQPRIVSGELSPQ